MDTRQALSEMGVNENTLTKEEKRQINEDGFVVLEGILSPSHVDAIATRMDEILNDDAERGTTIPAERNATNSQMFYNLVDKGEMFDISYTHPRVLAAQAEVLGYDMRFSDLNGRFVLPGEGAQGLHPDWFRLETPGVFQACNSMWLLDDFTETNGATRMVPGSHLLGDRLPSDFMDPNDKHPDEVQIFPKAGAVVVFNCHTWHSGTQNRSSHRRRVFHACYRRRAQQQKYENKNILPETRARLSNAALYLIDA